MLAPISYSTSPDDFENDGDVAARSHSQDRAQRLVTAFYLYSPVADVFSEPRFRVLSRNIWQSAQATLRFAFATESTKVTIVPIAPAAILPSESCVGS